MYATFVRSVLKVVCYLFSSQQLQSFLKESPTLDLPSMDRRLKKFNVPLVLKRYRMVFLEVKNRSIRALDLTFQILLLKDLVLLFQNSLLVQALRRSSLFHLHLHHRKNALENQSRPTLSSNLQIQKILAPY